MRSEARFYILSINPLRAIWKFKTADDKEISFTEIIRHRNPVFAKQTTTKKDLASTIYQRNSPQWIKETYCFSGERGRQNAEELKMQSPKARTLTGSWMQIENSSYSVSVVEGINGLVV